jgi:uncharacterized membrane protein YjjP (DUF1212 family)
MSKEVLPVPTPEIELKQVHSESQSESKQSMHPQDMLTLNIFGYNPFRRSSLSKSVAEASPQHDLEGDHLMRHKEQHEHRSSSKSRRMSRHGSKNLRSAVHSAAVGDTIWHHHQLSEIQKKKILLLKLARMLYEYGCPVRRLEAKMRLAAASLNVHGDFACIPRLMIASIGDPTTEDSETVTFRMKKGIDLVRLAETEIVLHEVTDSIHVSEEQIGEMLNQLDSIATPKYSLYSTWSKIFWYGICSGSSLVGWPGGWREIIINFCLGAGLVGTFSEFQAFQKFTGPLLELVVATFASFAAKALAMIPLETPLCYWSITLGTIVWLLPGLSLTTSVMELSNGNIISGAVNLFYAMVLSLLLGFGIAFGDALAYFAPSSTMNMTCSRQFSDYWEIILFPLFNMSIAILLNAHWRQWLPMFIVCTGSYVIYRFSIELFTNTISTTICAFFVSVMSHLLHRLFPSRIHTVPCIFAGIMLLLPGSLGVKGAKNIVDSNYSGAIAFGFTMLQVALAITVGTFAATPFVEIMHMDCWRRFGRKHNMELKRQASGLEAF